ncbi:MAG: allantoinase PuuE [Pseudomonadaceae bacterium]|nr:allantoinase PuuE [Pseudomonadaceae bacterium]
MTDDNLRSYPRDLFGYGANPPHANWPNGARIAVQFVVNIEEGAENSVLHGDAASETFLSEIVGAAAYPARHMSMESLYEYGSRAGFWRLHRLFGEFDFPVTAFGVAMALERQPEAVQAMLAADWEIASHGYRWIDHQFMEKDEERRQIAKAIEIHERVTGSRPLGWYTGRDSPNTRELVLEAGGFAYDSDYYGDDLPFWYRGDPGRAGEPHLIIPYTLDANDMRFSSPAGFNSGDQFFAYLRDTFDELYLEGESAPKMMSVGLHCRIAGKPGRTRALRRFLEHVSAHSDVWVCRRVDIARHWASVHPPA